MTNLEWALKYVKLKIQQMIFTGRKTDMCGIVLYGTEGTDNPVSDDHGGYDHVSMLFPIHTPTTRTIAALDQIQGSTSHADFLDGLIVALYIQNSHLSNKPSWTRKAILITDGESPMELEDNDIEATLAKINESKVELTIVGVDFDDPDYGYEEADKSNIKRQNEEIYHEFANKITHNTSDACYGKVGTCAQAIEVVREPEIKSTKSTLMGNTLTIGDYHNRPDDSIAINIQMAKATSTLSPVPLKKFLRRQPRKGESASEAEHPSQSTQPAGSQAATDENQASPLSEYVPLEIRPQYLLRSVYEAAQDREREAAAAKARSSKTGGLDDDDVNESDEAKLTKEEISDIMLDLPVLEKDELVKAYKYGLTWVPIEDSSDKLPTLKGMEIIGFAYQSSFVRDWSMGEVYYIFGDKGTPKSQVAFSSLVQAMVNFTRKGDDGDEVSDPMMAIVRYVSRDGSDPKMGIAIARSLEKVDYMVFVKMPFAEDLRQYNFPSLDIIKDKAGKPKTTHSSIPTTEMQDAMDELVLACSLEDAGPKDDDGVRTSWYEPTDAVHPAHHRMKEAIFHAATTNDLQAEPVPLPHPMVTKYFERPKRVITRSLKAAEKCKELLNVSLVPPRVAFRKKKANPEALGTDANVPLSLAELLGGDAVESTWADWNPAPLSASPKKPVAGAVPSSSPAKSPKKRRVKPSGSVESDDGEVTEDEDEAEGEKMDIDQSPIVQPLKKPEVLSARPRGRGSRIIGNATPLSDFQQNLERGDLVTQAVVGMGQVIPEIIADSFGDSRYEEAIECMKAMRRTAVEEDEVEEWNSFMKRFKAALTQANAPNADFWKLIQAKGMSLSLIHDGEQQDSDVSRRGTQRFIES
ncbi:SPOC domain-like protein [Clavulina sp. PMI_390]|nr:SPOC domain-like protein [Clavulina sp. PMI_390]